MDVRLFVDPPATGSWNMAADEVLLREAAEHRVCSLRFYQWSEPTLSLGYFQSYEERTSHRPSLTCPLVRRASGGGAILHDLELTYSYSIPVDSKSSFDSEALYDAFHGSLVTIFREQGVDCRLAGADSAATKQDAFLCFQRRSPADIIVQGTKVAGSAQRKQKGAILQHGSILLRRSDFAPELPGLDRWFSTTAADLSEAWQIELAKKLRVDLAKTEWDDGQRSLVKQVEVSKFGFPKWTQRR